eukprot:NODE_1393_length_610_cov_219.909091_g1106_i0.p1 GENE.NODE_1393_length_610_cov_219.909091_g1106_i0~~NODE_1393_length_610_cov_219.909091_g1106_i0.p1  ORF type:complete len:62 (-),score=1.21 NODE_1393_length_610_cov_219.909091_g1106_i0:368-553(-)
MKMFIFGLQSVAITQSLLLFRNHLCDPKCFKKEKSDVTTKWERLTPFFFKKKATENPPEIY